MPDDTNFEFCPELADMLRTRRTTGRQGKILEGLSGISTVNNLICLRRLCMERKPRRTLEIGMCFGASCLLLSACHRELTSVGLRQHVALDPFQYTVWQDAGLMAVQRAGLSEYLDFRQVPSSLALPQLLREDARFDLIYVDGSHLVEDVFVDAYFCVRLLTVGGVVAFDDSSDPHVAKVLRFLRNNLSSGLRELDISPYRPGGSSWRYRLAKMLDRTQLTVFERIGCVEREWDSAFNDF